MITGFDFGTSNCAMGVIDPTTNDVKLLTLEQGKAFIPSALYALDRDLISEQVGLQIADNSIQQEFINASQWCCDLGI